MLASRACGNDKAAMSVCFRASADCEVTFCCDGLSHPGITNAPFSFCGAVRRSDEAPVALLPSLCVITVVRSLNRQPNVTFMDASELGLNTCFTLMHRCDFDMGCF